MSYGYKKQDEKNKQFIKNLARKSEVEKAKIKRL